MHSFKLTIFAMAAAVKDVLAWDLKDPILSCADVSCPYDGVNPTCTVVNDTFIGVGIVPIPDLPDVLSGTSLIKAVGLSQSDDDTQNVVEVRASDTIGPNTTFRSAYYLGTPASLDPSKLSGCLVVFHDNRDGLHFNSLGDVPNIEMDTGFCADVISQDCTNELQNMAMEAMEHTESCRALDQMLQNTPTKSCDDFAGLYRGLGSYTVVDASNLSPITKEDNSTSDCWPVFPKEAQLSSVLIEQATVGVTAKEILTEVHRITPILTVLKAQDMNASSAQLSCTKMVHGYDPNAPGLAADEAARSSLSVLGLLAVSLFALVNWL